jgi:hypothetical protein
MAASQEKNHTNSTVPVMKFDFSYQKQQPAMERTGFGDVAPSNSVSPRVHQLASMSPRVRGRQFVEASSSSAFALNATIPDQQFNGGEDEVLFSFDADDLQRFELPVPQKPSRFLTASTEFSTSMPMSIRPLPPSHPRSSASGKGGKKPKPKSNKTGMDLNFCLGRKGRHILRRQKGRDRVFTLCH